MDHQQQDRDAEQEKIILKYVRSTLISIFVVVIIAGVLGFIYNDWITESTEWIAKKTGFLGLVLTILIADSILPAFPTDIVLFIIAKSSLQSEWGIYVLIIGITSIIGGIFGWHIGRWLRNNTSSKWLNKIKENNRMVEKYGFIGVSIGALTPFPFSLTCWSAGFLNLPFNQFLKAAFFRIPRYMIYFIAIKYSDQLIDFFF